MPGGGQGRGHQFGDRGAEQEGGSQKLVCRGRAWLQGIPCMDFTSAAWATSGGCWGSPSMVPLTHTSANPTTNHQKKPRQGSGAREIREIRTILAMKPLQTLKGSTQSAHHLRRLAGLDPFPEIAAEPEGGTDSKQRKGARRRIDNSTPAGAWASCIVSRTEISETPTG